MSNCLLLAASHRPASLNRMLVRRAAPLLEAEGFTAETPGYGEFDLPLFNDDDRERGAIPGQCRRIAERFERMDALVIASPEYNWSYPGSLKNLMDWMSHFSPSPLAGKPALLMSATPSKRGGVLGLAHLKSPLEALGMFVYPSSLLLPEAHTAFTSAGAFADAGQERRLLRLITEFSRYAKTLRAMPRLS